MKVTVLIPSWNAAAYIGRALDSLINSGHQDLEVLIMDNQSTDGTEKIVNEFGDKRLQYLAKKDNGMYEALNRGVAQAKGEIICWLGADDQHHKNALKKVLAHFVDPNVQWVVGDGSFLFEGEGESVVREHRLPYKVTLPRIAFGNPLISPSVFFRKTLFERVGEFNERYKYAADYDLWLRFARTAEPHVLHEPLSIFSYNGSNVSSKSKIKMYQETLDILRRSNWPEISGQRAFNTVRIHLYIIYNRLKQLLK